MPRTTRPTTTAPQSYLAGGELKGMTTKSSVRIRATNRTTGDYFEIITASDAKFQVNLANLTDDGTVTGTHTAYTNGDIIDFRVLGDGIGATQHTMDTSKSSVSTLSITATDVSSTNVPEIRL